MKSTDFHDHYEKKVKIQKINEGNLNKRNRISFSYLLMLNFGASIECYDTIEYEQISQYFKSQTTSTEVDEDDDEENAIISKH